MPFPKTIELICKYNTNPFAKTPIKFSIRANDVKANDGLKISLDQKKEINYTFLKEYKENNKNGVHFFGCLHETFVQNYNHDLKYFLKRYDDGDEVAFIMTELGLGIMKFEFPFITDSDRFEMMLSLKKRFNFLEKRLHSLGYDLEYLNTPNKKSTLEYEESYNLHKNSNFEKHDEPDVELKWQKSVTALVEVTKVFSLMDCFGENITEKNLANQIGKAFNCEIPDYEKTKSKILNRADLTIFLDEGAARMVKWRKTIDEKKKENNNKC